MLSYTTKARLAEFLLALNDGERQIEIIRQILCEQETFEPYAAFKRIDRLKVGAINAVDIKKFLDENKVYHSERSCHIFVQRYDADDDGQLNYTEFLQSVLTTDNTALRTVTTQRPNYDVASDQYLPDDIEYALSKLMNKEIQLYLNLDSQRRTLLEFHDFNYANAFAVIDKQSTGTINYDNLRAFFKAQAIYPGDEEVIAILRRLDRDDDGLVTFDEFVETIEPFSDALKATANRRNASAKYSPAAKLVNSYVSTSIRKEASPHRKTASPSRRVASPTRSNNLSDVKVSSFEAKSMTPTRVITASYRDTVSSNKKNDLLNRREASPHRREASPHRKEASPFNKSSVSEKLNNTSTPIRSSSPLRKIATPTRVQQNESHISQSPLPYENRETNPSLRRSQIYKDFSKDQSRSPLRTRTDECQSATTFGLTREDLQTPEKKSVQNNRQSSTKKSVKKNLSFNDDVSYYVLIQTLKQFIVLDKDIEVSKQDVSLKSDFNLLDFFRTFDNRGHGSVTCRDFENALIKYGVYPNQDELNLFFNKIDLDNDGLLKFSDFAEIFTPNQKEYSNLLHNRTPIGVSAGNEIHHVFSQDTKAKIVKMLKLCLENEGSSESLRQRLLSKSDLTGHDIFKYLDTKGDGFVTSDELIDIFQQNDSFLTDREVKLLMERLDNDKDGKISYYELLGEISPKSEQGY